MRNTFADTFYEAGKEDPRLCIVVADISPAGSIAKFREDFPDRFINTGVAEQIMIGMCAGHGAARPAALRLHDRDLHALSGRSRWCATTSATRTCR